MELQYVSRFLASIKWGKTNLKTIDFTQMTFFVYLSPKLMLRKNIVIRIMFNEDRHATLKC